MKISLIVLATCAISGLASADVVINMPAPKSTPAVPAVASPASIAAAAAAGPDVGQVALTRYARARTNAYDTYSDGPSYYGIRQYSYPVVHGFPFFGCFPHHRLVIIHPFFCW